MLKEPSFHYTTTQLIHDQYVQITGQKAEISHLLTSIKRRLKKEFDFIEDCCRIFCLRIGKTIEMAKDNENCQA